MKRTRSLKKGFTLIELMIVILIVGVLAAISIPAFQKYLQASRTLAFAVDVKALANAGMQYSLESGLWVPDTSSGRYPTQLEGYFSEKKFNLGTPLGGDWDFEQDGIGDYSSAVGVHNPNADDSVFAAVDAKIDDGNLSTGQFQKIADKRYYWIIED